MGMGEWGAVSNRAVSWYCWERTAEAAASYAGRKGTMAEEKKGALYSTGKLIEELGVPAGKVKKLIEELKLKPDDVKGACKYYGPAALKKLKAAVAKG